MNESGQVSDPQPEPQPARVARAVISVDEAQLLYRLRQKRNAGETRAVVNLPDMRVENVATGGNDSA